MELFPIESKVMKRSTIGEAEALPGYFAETELDHKLLDFNKDYLLLKMKDPPTGTMKFLSVLCTTMEHSPFCIPSLIMCAIFEHHIPYALLTTWNKLYFFAKIEFPTTSSGTLGAKQLVVETIARMFYAPSSFIFS